jgi:hypothetical protein
MSSRIYGLLLFVLAATMPALKVRSQAVEFPENMPLKYSAVRFSEGEDPHAYGVSFEICKTGGTWDGFISEYLGSVADPPAGKLDDLRLDEARGTISFASLLTLGLTLQKGEWVPVRSHYTFSGRIANDRITGVLSKEQAGAGKSTSEDLDLPRAADVSANATSCNQWSGLWTRRLDLRNAAGR